MGGCRSPTPSRTCAPRFRRRASAGGGRGRRLAGRGAHGRRLQRDGDRPRGGDGVLQVALVDLEAPPRSLDAAVAMLSLHHVVPLGHSLRRLTEVRRHGARPLVDEFDVARFDRRASAVGGANSALQRAGGCRRGYPPRCVGRGPLRPSGSVTGFSPRAAGARRTQAVGCCARVGRRTKAGTNRIIVSSRRIWATATSATLMPFRLTAAPRTALMPPGVVIR